jgi:hypothetical protein
MASITLALILAATISVAAGVLKLFGGAMDRALSRCTMIEGQNWSLYSKFALFVTALKGGLELGQLETLSGQPTVTLSRCIFEVYRSSAAALWYSVFGLLAFFAATQLLTIVSSRDSTASPSGEAEKVRV